MATTSQQRAVGAVQPERADEGATAPERLRRPVRAYLGEILKLSLPLKKLIALFAAITLGGSFIQMVGLVAMALGFTVAESGGGPPPPGSAWLTGIMERLAFSSQAQVIAMFSLFLLFTLLAAALMHLAWIVRLKLLSEFEGDQTDRALRFMHSTDPRDRAEMPRRPTLLALRSDCKSMRVVLQMLLLIATSLLTIVFPLGYMLALEPMMAVVGLVITLSGFYPVSLLARRAGAMSLPRQDVHRAAGSEVAGMLQDLQSGDISDEEAEKKIAAVRAALGEQHRFWRQQYEMRSLALQVPTAFALLAAFVVLLWGVLKVGHDAMSWGELLTFVVAARVVFMPFSQIGNRWIKSAEHIPRAARHLDFMNDNAETARTAGGREHLPEQNGIATVSSLQLVDRSFPSGRNGSKSMVSLTLQRGDMLAIVDPELGPEHRLRRELLGEVIVRDGMILLDGKDINRIANASIRHAIAMRPVCKVEGTFFECVQQLVPGADRTDVQRFVECAMGERPEDWLPDGLETMLTREGKVTHDWGKNATLLVEAYALLRSGRRIALVDYFIVGDAARREALFRATQYCRDELIVIWLDTAPRFELGRQHLLLFRGGVLLEQTTTDELTADRFAARYRSWDMNRVNRKIRQPQRTDVNEGTIDDDDDELEDEEL